METNKSIRIEKIEDIIENYKNYVDNDENFKEVIVSRKVEILPDIESESK